MRLLTGVAVTLLIFPASLASADFWVSVGSLRSMEQAERLRLEASDRLGTSFELSPAETPAGYFYRVVIGPFSRDEAARQAEMARVSGYPKAWMMNQPAITATARPGPAVVESALSRYSLPSYSDEPTYNSSYDVAYPPAPLPPDSTNRATRDPVLVAPPGYGLNRLERD